MAYEIKKNNLQFDDMNTRRWTKRLVIHHAAATKCSVEDIHRWHKENGWSGIGYHFLVRKDGSIWEGRPIDKVGAHAYGYNNDSIGICFEGNFEEEKMSAEQKKAGKWLVSYVKGLYPNITTIQRHKDLMATDCPGRNFPFAEIKKGTTSTKTETTVKTESYTQKQFIKDVQKATGSAVDGIAGSETLGNTVTVSRYKNNQHAVVKAIQKRLNALGFNCGTVDGIAGPKFDSAVKQYQKANNCVVDGEITARNLTWQKLLGIV